MRNHFLFFFLFLPLFLSSGVYAQDDVFSLKGEIRGLQSVSIEDMQTRSDGRYLFFHSGGDSWRVLDLLDFVTLSEPVVSENGQIYGAHLLSDDLLAVVTSVGVEYYDVEKVFAPELQVADYERPSAAEGDVADSCSDSEGRIYILEQEYEFSRHIIRVIRDRELEAEIQWSSVFSSRPQDYFPNFIVCASDGLLISTTYTPDDDSSENLLARIPLGGQSGAAQVINFDDEYEDFAVADLSLDVTKQNLLVMLNRISPIEDVNDSEDDAQVLEISSSNLGSRRLMEVGADGRAVASFYKRDTLHYAFFVNKDFLESSSNPPSNVLLNIPAASFGDNDLIEEDRGLGGGSLGAKTVSKWISSSNDRYAMGISASTGVSLLTDGPSLSFAGLSDTVPTLSQAAPLEFKLLSDTRIKYEIRFDEDSDLEGEDTGISSSFGELIQDGVIEANLSEADSEILQVTADELEIKKNGTRSFVIFAREAGNSNAPLSRLGLSFSYDPPPESVSEFRLGFGDMSVHVFFRLNNETDDLSHAYIHFSTDPSDLNSLPTSEAGISSRSITDAEGNLISSPIRVEADKWGGRFIIDPVINRQVLYVRVQVVDKQGQFSSGDPAALAIPPWDTRSLVAAFGSAESCSSSSMSSNQFSFRWMLLFFLTLGFGAVARQIWAKKNGPSV